LSLGNNFSDYARIKSCVKIKNSLIKVNTHFQIELLLQNNAMLNALFEYNLTNGYRDKNLQYDELLEKIDERYNFFYADKCNEIFAKYGQ